MLFQIEVVSQLALLEQFKIHKKLIIRINSPMNNLNFSEISHE